LTGNSFIFFLSFSSLFHIALGILKELNLRSFRLAFSAPVFQRAGRHLLKTFVLGGWLLLAASRATVMKLESPALAQISMASN
jgi:hypothetical protein